MSKKRGILNSVYFRLFLVLAMLILPLLITQIVTYNTSDALVTDEFYSIATANVQNLKNHYEDVFDSINAQMTYLSHYEAFISFLARSKSLRNHVYYTEIKNIQDQLNYCEHNSEYVKQIRLYFPRQNLCIYSDRERLVRYLSKDTMESIISDYEAASPKVISRNNDIVAATAFPSSLTKTMPSIYMEFVLNEDALGAVLSAYDTYNGEFAFALNHQSGQTIRSNALINAEYDMPLIDRHAGQTVFNFHTTINSEPYLAVGCYSGLLDFSFVQLVPQHSINYISDNFLFVSIFSLILTGLGVLLYVYTTNRIIRVPTNALIEAFETAGSGNLNMTLHPVYLMEYNKLVTHYNGLVSRMKDLIQSNYEHEIRLKRAELKRLESQINPHFLYNSFFMLRHMVQNRDIDSAVSLLDHLGNYFKFITRNASEETTLLEEYTHALDYLSIQSERFDMALKCDPPVLPEEISGLKVPRLILQPIIENAIIHCPPSFNSPLEIRLDFAIHPEKLVISIENNGTLDDATLKELQRNIRKADGTAEETTGLINISKRLDLFYHGGAFIRVDRGPLNGLRVVIELSLSPINEMEE